MHAGPSRSQSCACCASLGESQLQHWLRPLRKKSRAANYEVNATLGQGLHQLGSRVTSVQDQHIAPAQAVELIKEQLALGLGANGHVRHQIIARQVRAQVALNGGGQRAGAQTSALGGRQHNAIGTDQVAALVQVQLALVFNGIDQAVIERPQGGHMQLGGMWSINRALFIDADEEHGPGYEMGSAMFQGRSAS